MRASTPSGGTSWAACFVLAWAAVLWLPSLTLFGPDHFAQYPPVLITAISAWVLCMCFVLLRPQALAIAGLPVAVAGIAVLGADRLAHVDLLQLLAVWPTFTADEVAAATRPYWEWSALAVLLLGGLALQVARAGGWPRARPAHVAALMVPGALLLAWADHDAWMESWPLRLVTLAGDMLDDAAGAGFVRMEDQRQNPRDPRASWQASRAVPAAGAHETYVLLIGESIRADSIPGCGGDTKVLAPPAGALLFCDMLSGASGTHVSVPLLISREAPGHPDRVSSDATFLKAFAEVGFDTFWLSKQERMIAWPDARYQFYDAYARPERKVLLPALRDALTRPAPRKALVLHAYNAHFPYTQRYEAGTAPFAIDNAVVDTDPAERRKAYKNAVDASNRFLADVIDELRKHPGEVFFAMTSDHGENLQDDARELTFHALKWPTWWDTRVPLIVWANDAWKREHAAAWSALASHRTLPLMHMDVVPTLLGAAGIRYQEPRRDARDLTVAGQPTARVRRVHGAPGKTIPESTLRSEAGLALR